MKRARAQNKRGWFLLFAALVALPIQGKAAETPTGSLTAVLEHEVLAAPVFQTSFQCPAAVFQKEPDTKGHRVLRSFLTLGGSATNQWMGFLYDKKERTLYLDLNRNRDLTDDPEGVFQGAPLAGSMSFTNIPLVVQSRQGRQRFLVNLNLRESNDQMYGIVGVRSIYAGKLEANGRAWQVGLVRNPFVALDEANRCVDGGFLLRPWEERQTSFVLSPSWETINFTTNLFFQGQAYGLQFQFDQQADNAVIRMEWQPQATALARLELQGKDIYRVVLERSGKYVVVLDQPANSVPVPVGTYGNAWAVLKKGNAEAMGNWRRPVVLKENQSVRLTFGGPLKNLVTTHRAGGYLRMDHQVLGADGLRYQMLKPAGEAPTFAIHQGEKKLADGQFRFG